jgi:signal transduction histidine kinase
MKTREMLRLSWRAWLSDGAPRVGPWWLGHAWTIVFALAVGAAFSVLSLALSSAEDDGTAPVAWPTIVAANVLISLAIAISVRLAFWLARRGVGGDRLARWPAGLRSIYFTIVPIAGVALGWPLGMLAAGRLDARFMTPFERPELLGTSIVVALFITALFQQFFRSKSRQIAAENRASEAQLRLLQAQIEPHFLFNTLANVVSLMEVDAARAKTMLEAFVDYLRASLSGLGHGRHTLGDEIDLVDAYMRIIKIRMEDRLDYSIEVPAALRDQPLPALTLQPLVENAIVHGLEPQIAGGRVRIGARSDGRSVVITVDDDGAGLAAVGPALPRRAGAGTALANIRKRLEQTYGSGATLDIRAGASHGVHARLSLPLAPV